MSADLAGFLLAQLDADEEVARAATPGPWRDDCGPSFVGNVRVQISGNACVCTTTGTNWAGLDAAHIALHDPAFELDRIAALRAVVELLDAWSRDFPGSMRLALLRLAQPYRGRAGWRDEWGTP